MPRKTVTAKQKLPDTVGTNDLAKALGITTRWVSRLATDGVLPKDGRGNFPLVSSIQAYLAWKLESEKKKASSTSADRLRERREAEIARKMMRDDREIISLDEAMQSLDEAVGLFIEVIDGLPARIARGDMKERRRIEDICNAERDRLSKGFSEKAQALRSGLGVAEDPEEDDA